MPTKSRNREVPAHLAAVVAACDRIVATLKAQGRPYAALLFRRDYERFINPRISEANYRRLVTCLTPPLEGWPERRRKRNARKERPLPPEGISGAERARELKAMYGKGQRP